MNEDSYGDESEGEHRHENQYEDGDESQTETGYEYESENEDGDESKNETEYEGIAEGDEPIAKIYYGDEEATQVDAAFVIEDWDWVVGFNQVATDEYDYVSIPVGKVIGVMSPKYTTFSRNGRRVTGYGIDEAEAETFAGQLPI
jgi:hypothetical protein